VVQHGMLILVRHYAMNFTPSLADPDVWLCPATKPDGSEYCKYILVYIDDVLAISHDPQTIIMNLATD
jgi:hypothetical protein